MDLVGGQYLPGNVNIRQRIAGGCSEHSFVEPVTFPDAAFKGIAIGCLPKGPGRHRNQDLGWVIVSYLLSKEDLERKSRKGFSLLKEVLDDPFAGQSFIFLKAKGAHGHEDSPWPGVGLFALERLLVRNREFFAAFFAAGSQHPAAVGRRHALTESVFVLSLSAGRLIGAFHGR